MRRSFVLCYCLTYSTSIVSLVHVFSVAIFLELKGRVCEKLLLRQHQLLKRMVRV